MKGYIIVVVLSLCFMVNGVMAQEVIVNGGFDDDVGWSVSCVNASGYTCGTAEFGYTEDGPKYGEGPCLNLYVDLAAFSQVMVYQTVELEPNATYQISCAFKELTGLTYLDMDPSGASGDWYQMYISPEPFTEDGSDYTPPITMGMGFWGGGGGNSINIAGVDSTWEGYADGGSGPYFTVPDTLDSYEYLVGIKVGVWGPTPLLFHEILIDNFSMKKIGGADMVKGGRFGEGSESEWITLNLSDTGALDPEFDFNYIDDVTIRGPSAGYGSSLNIIGGPDDFGPHGLLYQPLVLEGGRSYRLMGAWKDYDAVASFWLQVYLHPDEPIEGQDYTPDNNSFSVSHNTWQGTQPGFDDTFDDGTEANNTVYTVPGEGPQTIYLSIKVGSGYGTAPYFFDIGVDEVMLIELDDTYVKDISEGWIHGFQLVQNYPNPFNPSTTIGFSLSNTETVKLSVFDVRGHHIKTLLDQSMASGDHSVVWDGRDQRGMAVPSGVYFYKLEAGTLTKSKKMILLQ
jgi:hypothetical protein